jgi:hypothetical protein
VKAVGVKAGRRVVVKTDLTTGQVTYTFSGAKQLPLSRNFVKRTRRTQLKD